MPHYALGLCHKHWAIFIREKKYDSTYINWNFLNETEIKESLNCAFSKLTSREQDILELRFYNDLTLENIANMNHVTRERVRQIEAKAIKKMEHILRKENA
jgi:DNA-directed RNA polymerase sigma subunit (sigma70/sigma32)